MDGICMIFFREENTFRSCDSGNSILNHFESTSVRVCVYLQFNVWFNACLPSPYPSIHPFVWLSYCRKCAILIYGCHDAKPCTAYTHMLDSIRSFAFVMRITHFFPCLFLNRSVCRMCVRVCVSFSMTETVLFFLVAALDDNLPKIKKSYSTSHPIPKNHRVS